MTPPVSNRAPAGLIRKTFTCMALACLLPAGCGNGGNNDAFPNGEQPVAGDDGTFLFEELPPGAGWEEVRVLFPDIGPPGPEGGYEGLGAEGLTEAETPVTVSGHPGALEFNFRNGRLYSAFWRIDDISVTTAEAMADSIADIYNDRFGQGSAERQDEPGSNAVTRFWRTDDIELTVSYGGMGERWFASWGYQVSPPMLRPE